MKFSTIICDACGKHISKYGAVNRENLDKDRYYKVKRFDFESWGTVQRYYCSLACLKKSEEAE
jgi:hypothetical protein